MITKTCDTMNVRELIASLQGVPAMADDMREVLQKKKFLEEAEEQVAKEMEDRKRSIEERKRKLDEEKKKLDCGLVVFSTAKRRKMDEEVERNRLEEKRTYDAIKVKIENVESFFASKR